jgi:UDPglucose 6-dehydrogenase
MNVTVVGCGYVGLITGLGLAAAGHRVTGVEQGAGRRSAVAAGEAPFHEPGLEELLRSELASGRFDVVAGVAQAPPAEVYLVAVQTPPLPDGAIDLRYLEEAVTEVARSIDSSGQPPVVAVRSTAVPGTTRNVVAPLLGDRAIAASNPEFLQEGSAVRDFLRPDRIVIGCDDERARAVLRELYDPLGAPLVFTSTTAAEVTKYTSNALLATLISFSNEIAQICEALPDVDVEEVLAAVQLDRRLTPRVDGELVRPGILSYLKAGCGYGGSCLPKDLTALIASTGTKGRRPLLEAVRRINDAQPARLVDLVEETVGAVAGRNVALLGVAFKGGTDDLRSSPGLSVLDELLRRGADVTVYDPLVREDALAEWTERGARRAQDLRSAVGAADVAVVTTDAPEFDGLVELARQGDVLVVDGRRRLRPDAFGDTRYRAVGRSAAPA